MKIANVQRFFFQERQYVNDGKERERERERERNEGENAGFSHTNCLKVFVGVRLKVLAQPVDEIGSP